MPFSEGNLPRIEIHSQAVIHSIPFQDSNVSYNHSARIGNESQKFFSLRLVVFACDNVPYVTL